MQYALRRLLRQTQQNILDAEGRIDQQRSIVAEMERAGADARIARELLRALQRGHSTLTVHLEQLRRMLPLRGRGNGLQRPTIRLSERPIDEETDAPPRNRYH